MAGCVLRLVPRDDRPAHWEGDVGSIGDTAKEGGLPMSIELGTEIALMDKDAAKAGRARVSHPGGTVDMKGYGDLVIGPAEPDKERDAS